MTQGKAAVFITALRSPSFNYSHTSLAGPHLLDHLTLNVTYWRICKKNTWNINRKKTYCMLTNQRIFIRKTLQKSIHSTIPSTLKCLTVEMFSRRALFMRGDIVRDAGEELWKSWLLKVGQSRSVQTLAAPPLSCFELSPRVLCCTFTAGAILTLIR